MRNGWKDEKWCVFDSNPNAENSSVSGQCSSISGQTTSDVLGGTLDEHLALQVHLCSETFNISQSTSVSACSAGGVCTCPQRISFTQACVLPTQRSDMSLRGQCTAEFKNHISRRIICVSRCAVSTVHLKVQSFCLFTICSEDVCNRLPITKPEDDIWYHGICTLKYRKFLCQRI